MTAVLPARALMGTPDRSWCGRRPEPTGAGRRAVRPLGWAGARVAELADALDLGSSARSEEHTSELQSRFDLVCRLLLEKKKKKTSLYCYTTAYENGRCV